MQVQVILTSVLSIDKDLWLCMITAIISRDVEIGNNMNDLKSQIKWTVQKDRSLLFKELGGSLQYS